MNRYLPRPATRAELTTAGLSPDGMTIAGWVETPADGIWKPEDLLWLPPSATKSTDVDRAGRIVDVTLSPGDLAFVTAEVAKHDRYIDTLRQRVRSGALKLTAWMAKMLGLPFDEDGVELIPRTGPLAALKSLQEPSEPHGAVWTPKRHWVS